MLLWGWGRAGTVELPELGTSAPAVACMRAGGRGFHALLDVPAVAAPVATPVAVDGHAAGTLRCAPGLRADVRVDARVVVCMATFEPPADLFAKQVASLQAQTLTGWRCIVSDDGSSELPEIADDRFVVLRHEERLGVLGNFERALAHVGPATEFVALADQDDVWHPGKLAALVDAIGNRDLVYANANVVDRDGALLRDRFFAPGLAITDDLDTLLVANTVPGAQDPDQAPAARPRPAVPAGRRAGPA